MLQLKRKLLILSDRLKAVTKRNLSLVTVNGNYTNPITIASSTAITVT